MCNNFTQNQTDSDVNTKYTTIQNIRFWLSPQHSADVRKTKICHHTQELPLKEWIEKKL